MGTPVVLNGRIVSLKMTAQWKAVCKQGQTPVAGSFIATRLHTILPHKMG